MSHLIIYEYAVLSNPECRRSPGGWAKIITTLTYLDIVKRWAWFTAALYYYIKGSNVWNIEAIEVPCIVKLIYITYDVTGK